MTILGGGIGVSGGRVGVTMPLLDTLVVLSSALEVAQKIPLDIVEDVTDIPDGRVDRRGFLDWLRTAQLVGPVQANADGWLIPLVRYGRDSTVDLLFVPKREVPPS